MISHKIDSKTRSSQSSLKEDHTPILGLRPIAIMHLLSFLFSTILSTSTLTLAYADAYIETYDPKDNFDHSKAKSRLELSPGHHKEKEDTLLQCVPWTREHYQDVRICFSWYFSEIKGVITYLDEACTPGKEIDHLMRHTNDGKDNPYQDFVGNGSKWLGIRAIQPGKTHIPPEGVDIGK